MNHNKRAVSLAGKLSLVVVIIVVFSMFVIGLFSYFIVRSDSITSSAEQARDIAIAVASAFRNPEEIRNSLDTNVKTPYWHEMREYLDEAAARTGVAYLFVLDSRYDSNVRYYMDADTWGEIGLDLGEIDPVEFFSDEMPRSIQMREPTASGIYDAGEYGILVSGFAPIFGSDGQPVAVVGADISVERVMAASNAFALRMILIIAASSVVFGFFIHIFVKRKVGAPLSALTRISDRISVGDTDIQISFQSNDEVGRLADSFRSMLKSEKEQAEVMQSIAQGDYSMTVNVRSDRDAMSQAINHMLEITNDTLSQINDSTRQVDAGAKQIAEGAKSLAQGTADQADSARTLSSSIAEIALKTKENAEMAGRAVGLADMIMQKAEKGSRQMDEMMNAVSEINDASQNINKVIKAIDDIAFQTNILALNAAVEAARAGSAGKGFAVVAEEVRNLAAKSAAAAKESGAMITNSIEKAELGAQIATETATSLAEIVSGINESDMIVKEIAKSSEDQSLGISQVNAGIDHVAQVIQLNSATAEENAAASQELSGQSNMLQELIAQFKLKDGGAVRGVRLSSSKRAAAAPVVTVDEPYYVTSGPGDFGKY